VELCHVNRSFVRQCINNAHSIKYWVTTPVYVGQLLVDVESLDNAGMQYLILCALLIHCECEENVFSCCQKDINKLGQQIQYCYSLNRRAADPIQVMTLNLCTFYKLDVCD